MKRIACMFVVALLMTPVAALAETVQGTLDEISLAQNLVRINGKDYEVNTEEARVLFRGQSIADGDLEPGDEVRMVLGSRRGGERGRKLIQLELIRPVSPRQLES